MLTRFERRGQHLLPFRRFLLRMGMFGGIALALDLCLIVAGMIGFHALEHLGWWQAALNAGLILTGNGPTHSATSPASQVFELFFALAGGITFMVVATVILAPVVHRVLHAFHLEPEATPAPTHRSAS